MQSTGITIRSTFSKLKRALETSLQQFTIIDQRGDFTTDWSLDSVDKNTKTITFLLSKTHHIRFKYEGSKITLQPAEDSESGKIVFAAAASEAMDKNNLPFMKQVLNLCPPNRKEEWLNALYFLDKNYDAPLLSHLAYKESCSPEIIKLLIKNGASLDSHLFYKPSNENVAKTPLMSAIDTKNKVFIRASFESIHKDKIITDPIAIKRLDNIDLDGITGIINYTIETNNLEMLQYCLNLGADPNNGDAIEKFYEHRDLTVPIEELIEQRHNIPLTFTIEKNNPGAFNILWNNENTKKEYIFDRENGGRTEFFYIIINKNLGMLKSLLKDHRYPITLSDLKFAESMLEGEHLEILILLTQEYHYQNPPMTELSDEEDQQPSNVPVLSDSLLATVSRPIVTLETTEDTMLLPADSSTSRDQTNSRKRKSRYRTISPEQQAEITGFVTSPTRKLGDETQPRLSLEKQYKNNLDLKSTLFTIDLHADGAVNPTRYANNIYQMTMELFKQKNHSGEVGLAIGWGRHSIDGFSRVRERFIQLLNENQIEYRFGAEKGKVNDGLIIATFTAGEPQKRVSK
jgi:hypothetical protein